MSAEELQLFLLLPPQCVDYGDGQPECFLGVTVWSEGVHSGTRCRDVLCVTQKTFKFLPLLFSYLFNLSVFPTTCILLPHRATEATLGCRRGSCWGCRGSSSWCSGPLWWCAAGGGPASAGRRPQSLAWTQSGEAESVNLREQAERVLTWGGRNVRKIRCVCWKGQV